MTPVSDSTFQSCDIYHTSDGGLLSEQAGSIHSSHHHSVGLGCRGLARNLPYFLLPWLFIRLREIRLFFTALCTAWDIPPLFLAKPNTQPPTTLLRLLPLSSPACSEVSTTAYNAALVRMHE